MNKKTRDCHNAITQMPTILCEKPPLEKLKTGFVRQALGKTYISISCFSVLDYYSIW
jgi:hypothetical protein